ncbi:MAG TPA: NAD-dependent epimerase/dehydratase family protein [Gemmatimonadaceae bacterium]|nr:NAD-dependent epimerase/dehydratase family protein [Gemmatimonadaceae bacterium]
MAKGDGKRVLITGGAGFIGSHVAELFLREGWSVSIIDSLVTGKRANVPQGAAFHELDIRSTEAREMVASGGFHVLVHLAAQMDVRKSVADPVFDAGTNIVGTLNLVEGVRAAGGKMRVVFSSTGGVIYGDFTTPPNQETFAKDPESPYAISKVSAEHYLAYYGRVHGIDAVSLRYGNVYGPRQDPHGEAGVVAIFCGRILRGEPLTIFGDGRQTRDYVYVGDVARATFIAATHALPPQEKLDSRAFNVGTGIGTPVVEIAEILNRVSGHGVPLQLAPKRPGEQQHSWVAIEKARRVLGWSPEVGLEDGLRRTYEWFAARDSGHRTVEARA